MKLLKTQSCCLRIAALALICATLAAPHAWGQSQTGLNTATTAPLFIGAGHNVFMTVVPSGFISLGTTAAGGMVGSSPFNGILDIDPSGTVTIGSSSPKSLLKVVSTGAGGSAVQIIGN